jgi:hypothetical protein
MPLCRGRRCADDRDKNRSTVPRVYRSQYGHDHLFGNDGNDYLNTVDGEDEPGHVEHILSDSVGGPDGFDK